MKRFLLFFLLLGGGLVQAQMAMPTLGEQRSTYANAEHVPADAWDNSAAVADAQAAKAADWQPARDHLSMSVFPNPTRDEASLNLFLPHSAALRVDLVDAAGRFLRTISETTAQPKGKVQQLVRLGDMPGGIYYLRVRVGGELHSLPLVKQ